MFSYRLEVSLRIAGFSQKVQSTFTKVVNSSEIEMVSNTHASISQDLSKFITSKGARHLLINGLKISENTDNNQSLKVIVISNNY